jgi:phosphate transport system protein
MPGKKALDELRELHREFLDLGTSVEELVAAAVRPLRAPDPGGVTSGGSGEELGRWARRIVERCRRIVLLYQPVAIDFREVTAILRMTAEMEHIGNRATGITGRTAALGALAVQAPPELSRLAETVGGMVRRFLDAYTLLDEDPVHPVGWMRTEVDRLAGVLREWLAGLMRADPSAVEHGLDLFAVVQSFQRIAEHATALAEEVAFLTEAAARRLSANHLAVQPVESVRTKHDS